MTKRSLLNKTENHVKSYADLGGCYHSTDNILLELHNGSYYTELLSVCVKYSTVCALVMRFQLANDQRSTEFAIIVSYLTSASRVGID